MQGQWGYVAISFIIGIAIAFSSSVVLLTCCLVVYVFFCLYRTSRKTFFYCMIACFSGAMYTAYVQGQNKPLRESYETTRGVIHTTPLINGDRLSFQVEDQNKNIVQLSYKMKSASEKKQMRQLHAGVSCVFEGERKRTTNSSEFSWF